MTPTRGIVDRLLGWFDARERDVPWRGETDPFAILLAEVMAQQTRIETVRPYYARFRSRFPDAASLARAELDEVLKLWEGLGYYARARNLHAAARAIVERHDGRVPSTVEGLLSLPGVGPYTAGAVGSLAFGLVEPAVDGNARRVLSRLFDLEDASPARLDRVARDLLAVRSERPAAINQAIMDLGGEVCTPKRPSCGSCPLSTVCLARARDTVAMRPPRKRRTTKPTRRAAAAFILEGDEAFVIQRPAEGLLGGLWDFPTVDIDRGTRGSVGGEAQRRARRCPRVLLERAAFDRHGLRVEVGEVARSLSHTFSHFKLELDVYSARLVSGPREPNAVAEREDTGTVSRWADPGELDRLAFPVYLRRLIDDGCAVQSGSGGTS